MFIRKRTLLYRFKEMVLALIALRLGMLSAIFTGVPVYEARWFPLSGCAFDLLAKAIDGREVSGVSNG